MKQAKEKRLAVNVYYRRTVTDLIDHPEADNMSVICDDGSDTVYEKVIICTGHLWPKKHEGETDGWFDSPYPPEKISRRANYQVAIRGASLTAIDAIRTLTRHNGAFEKDAQGILHYRANADSPDFRIVIHTRNGLLPAVSFHLEDTHLGKNTVLSQEVIQARRDANGGFLPLDFVFEKNFKKGIRRMIGLLMRRSKTSVWSNLLTAS